MLRSLVLASSLLAILGGMAQAEEPGSIAALRFLGDTRIPNDATADGTLIGGLSGLDFDPASGLWAIISDDKSEHSPARFYLAQIAITEGHPELTSARAVTLRQADGQAYPSDGGEVPDPESIRFDPADKTLWWTSEGDRKRGLSPFVRHVDQEGRALGALELPELFAMHKDQELGPRHNLTFEGLSFTPRGDRIWVAMESALYQDGPIATAKAGTVARFLRFVRGQAKPAQFAYPVDPIQADPQGRHGDNGVSEILALDDDRLLVVERSGVEGADGRWTMYIRIYEASAKAATDVAALPALAGAEYRPMTKRLVLDLSKPAASGGATLPRIDNIEGISFGPALPDGHRSLVLVSDNNFNPSQVTQILVFDVEP